MGGEGADGNDLKDGSIGGQVPARGLGFRVHNQPNLNA
jgi:hypothetical protein